MNLSPEMLRARDLALREGGGKLHRFPGGFWRVAAAHSAWFGTSTVQALVRRGAAEYTEWRRHGSGEGSQFPIEVTFK